jgi:hypothetical protein
VGQLLSPYFAALALRKMPLYRASAKAVPSCEVSEIDAIVWHNAKKLGISLLAVFVTQRSIAVIVSLFVSLSAFASFSLTLQVLNILYSIARVKLGIALATLSAHAARSEKRQFWNLFVSSMKLGVLLYVAGAIALVTIGPDILALLTTKITLVERPTLFLLIALYLNEIIYANTTWALTCFNTVPFVAPIWLTGAAMVVGALLVGTFTPWGTTGFVAVQLACHLAYNSWKWPLALAACCAEPARSVSALSAAERISERVRP